MAGKVESFGDDFNFLAMLGGEVALDEVLKGVVHHLLLVLLFDVRIVRHEN
jgi:hypothetical protein